MNRHLPGRPTALEPDEMPRTLMRAAVLAASTTLGRRRRRGSARSTATVTSSSSSVTSRGRGTATRATKEEEEDMSAVRVRSVETASEGQRTDLAVVLVTPKIPGNTGCIARTCAASRVPLHLVGACRKSDEETRATTTRATGPTTTGRARETTGLTTLFAFLALRRANAGPLGFSLDDTQLKRAGLDYWKSVCVRVHDDWDAFYEYWRGLDAPGRLVAFSKFGARPHAEEGAYRPGDWLLFGAETTGLPDAAMNACKETGGVRRIPIDESHVRSLNLSVSCGIGVYEALRQLDGSPSGPCED